MASEEELVARLKVAGQGQFRSGMRRAATDVRGVGRATAWTARQTNDYDRSLARADRRQRILSGSARAGVGGLRLFGYGVAGVTTLLGARGLSGVVRKSAEEFQESRKTMAQTRAVIKSTGGVAGVTAKHVDRLSNRLSRKTAIDDEQIASSSNLLLTFKNIKRQGGIFDRATASAVDLSAAGFGSVSTASKQLGKALNDPAKGLTSLNRVGVQFTAGEQKQIATALKHNDVLKAQRIEMREVESQVKGSAAAQATPIDRLRTNYANLAETLGKLGAPTANKGISALGRFTARLDSIAGRKDIDLGQKLKLSEKAAKDVFGPLVKEGGRTVKRMHLGDKLEDAIKWAAPKIAEGFAHAAPRAASAFVHAFVNTDVWGQLLIGGLLWKKMGGAGAWALLGRRGGAAMGKGVGAGARTGAGAAAGGAAAGGLGARAASRLPGSLKAVGGTAATIAALKIGSDFIRGYAKADAAVKVFGGEVQKLIDQGDRGGLKRLADQIREYADVNQGSFADSGKAARKYADQVENAMDRVSLAEQLAATATPPNIFDQVAGAATGRSGRRARNTTRATVRGHGLKAATSSARPVTPTWVRASSSAVLHVEVPVKVGRRELGRATASIAADDLARRGS